MKYIVKYNLKALFDIFYMWGMGNEMHFRETIGYTNNIEK